MSRKKRVISHRDFVRDLGRGARGEDIAEAFFSSEFGLLAENVSEKNPDYDLVIAKLDPEIEIQPKVVPRKLLRKIFRESFGCPKHKKLTVEVKYDEAAARYQNFFFEVFFDIDTGSPGTMFKCKADIIVWVVPGKRRKFSIYLFRRPELLAWFCDYMFQGRKTVKYKTPGISPQARGIAVPIKVVVESAACLGEFEFKY